MSTNKSVLTTNKDTKKVINAKDKNAKQEPIIEEVKSIPKDTKSKNN